MFHWKLLRSEWTRVHYSTIAFGVMALFLGSVSPELWGGGDAKISGIDGILAINGGQFFQMLVSFICWGWFAYQAIILFPVMRVHAVSLLLMWNGLVGAQVLFHRNNPSFPLGFELADMMGGDWEDDRAVLGWFDSAKSQIDELVQQTRDAAIQKTVADLVDGLSAEAKAALLKSL